MEPTEPLVSSQVCVYVLLALMAGPLVLLAWLSGLNFWRAWRRRRELENDFLLRVGMQDAWRRGLITDGDQ